MTVRIENDGTSWHTTRLTNVETGENLAAALRVTDIDIHLGHLHAMPQVVLHTYNPQLSLVAQEEIQEHCRMCGRQTNAPSMPAEKLAELLHTLAHDQAFGYDQGIFPEEIGDDQEHERVPWRPPHHVPWEKLSARRKRYLIAIAEQALSYLAPRTQAPYLQTGS